MGKEGNAERCRQGIIPSYVEIAEYIQKHIDDKTPLTRISLIRRFHATPTMVQYCLDLLPSVASDRTGLHLSQGANILTLMEEVEQARQRPATYNYMGGPEKTLRERPSGFVKAASHSTRKR